MKRYVIIVAGGKGIRMNNTIPKQFMLLQKKPILMHTLGRFYSYDPLMKIILVLPEDQQDYWKKLCHDYCFTLPYVIANGGETRFHSVKNGLAHIEPHSIVGIHDGVRPFVSQEVIDLCYRTAEKKTAVVPVIPVVETLRQFTSEGNITVNRENYRLVQTPQVFQSDILIKAYHKPYQLFFTDDASVVEDDGEQITLVEGNRENIKITTPYDLLIGESIAISF